jgi:hypothetical protein
MAEQAKNDEMVVVFDTEQESEALIVQGLLESAGIENFITSLDAPQDVLPVGGVVIQVSPEKADEARKVIDEYRASAASDPDLNEEQTA